MKSLAKEFGNLVATHLGSGTFNITTNGGQWRQPQPPLGQFVCDTYFDLAGMAMDYKTLFFEAAGVQEVTPPSATGATAGDGVVVVDLMTTIPLTDTQVLAYGGNGNFPGAPNSGLTFEQTVYGRVRIFNVDVDNAAGGYYIQLSDHQTGSMKPTASDRIYCYRAVFFGQNNSVGDHTITPARFLLRANAKEESELEYIMRLVRSYELQNEPDRD